MSDIYLLIGRIIKHCQYIENNLSISCAYRRILKIFDNKKTAYIDEFDKALKKADEILDILKISSLGRIIQIVKDYDVFDDFEMIDRLEKILIIRNDLIHQYFKDNNFEQNRHNDSFIEKEKSYLKNILLEVRGFNDDMGDVLERLKNECMRIRDVKKD